MTSTDERLAVPVAPYSQAQVRKALGLIARNGLTPAGREGVYRAASSDGVTSYLTCAVACSCLSPGPCYHMAAVALAAAHGRPFRLPSCTSDVFDRTASARGPHKSRH